MCALGSPSSAFGNLAGLPTKMEIRKSSLYPGNLDAGRALVLPKPFCPFNNTAWLLDCAMAARLPTAIRAFHFPGSRPSFAAGTLNVTGLGSILFPTSPQRVVVRTRALPGEQVEWLRCFGGMKYLKSIYLWSRLARRSEPEVPRLLHDVEAMLPLQFHLDWNSSCALEPGPGGGVLSSKNGKAALIGTNVTLPKSFALLDL